MGTLRYGSPGIEVHFDDRTLMHLQIVITAKLRRKESFVFTWLHSVAIGSGRSSVWLDSSIPLFYRYTGPHLPTINTEWLGALMAAANNGSELLFTLEPVPGGATPPPRPAAPPEISGVHHRSR
jgi:hypothetical protein